MSRRKIILSAEVAKMLIHLREDAGLTQEHLAQLADVPLDVLQSIEDGSRKTYGQETLQAILETLRRYPKPRSKFKPTFGKRAKVSKPAQDSARIKTPRIKGTGKRGPKPHNIDWDKVPLGQTSDADVATSLGVGIQAVEKARRARRIPRFKDENAGRHIQVNWDVVAPFLGKVPDDELAGKIGTTRQRVGEERKGRGIPMWKRGSRKASLAKLVDGSWYVDGRSLWERVDEVVKSLEADSLIRPIELLARFKLSMTPSNIEDAIKVLDIIGWRKQPNEQWKRPGLRRVVRSSEEHKSDKVAVLAFLMKGGSHSSTQVAAACNLSLPQAFGTLQKLHTEGKIKVYGQAKARRYLFV